MFSGWESSPCRPSDSSNGSTPRKTEVSRGSFISVLESPRGHLMCIKSPLEPARFKQHLGHRRVSTHGLRVSIFMATCPIAAMLFFVWRDDCYRAISGEKRSSKVQPKIGSSVGERGTNKCSRPEQIQYADDAPSHSLFAAKSTVPHCVDTLV
jgi:hypothetical protein